MTATKQQPIAGYRISDPSDPTIKPWLSETPDDNGYTSEPLYAGAAPVAVARWGVAAWMTPEGDRVVTAETMDGARKDGGASLSSLRPYTVALVRAGEPAAAAPALEAPAAPVLVGDEQADAYLTEPGRLESLARSHPAGLVRALARAALAAAPQAPAAPSADYARMYQNLADAMGYDSGKDGIEWSPEEWAAHLLAAYQAAPAAPAVDAQAERDAAFEAVRQRLCRIPRWSFHIDSRGNLRRVDDARGNWIEFSAAHELFDPVAVDSALAAQAAAKGAAS